MQSRQENAMPINWCFQTTENAIMTTPRGGFVTFCPFFVFALNHIKNAFCMQLWSQSHEPSLISHAFNLTQSSIYVPSSLDLLQAISANISMQTILLMFDEHTTALKMNE